MISLKMLKIQNTIKLFNLNQIIFYQNKLAYQGVTIIKKYRNDESHVKHKFKTQYSQIFYNMKTTNCKI